MGHHKHNPGRHAPPGVWMIPDGQRVGDFVWTPIGRIKHDVAVLEEMWARYRATKDKLDAEWLAEQKERVRLIGLEIEESKQQQMMEEVEQRDRDWLRKDAEDTAEWGRRYQDALNRAVDKVISREERKLANLNRVIGQHTAKQKFEAYRRRMHR